MLFQHSCGSFGAFSNSKPRSLADTDPIAVADPIAITDPVTLAAV